MATQDLSTLTPATLTLRPAAVDGRGIATTETTYAVSDQAADAPTTGWQSVMPTVDTGQYLWTRIYITYTDGKNPTTYYTVSLQGKDGTDGLTAQPNIINGSGFARGTNAWETQKGVTFAKTGGVWQQGYANILNTASEIVVNEYTDNLEQTLYSSSDTTRLKPSTWYTLSFYVRRTFPTGYTATDNILTYIHKGTGSNNPVDDTITSYVDGVATTLRGDGECTFSLGTDFERHTITFKTAATLDQARLLFRTYPHKLTTSTGKNYMWHIHLTCVKLEESESATPWQLSETDRIGDTGAQGLQGCICRVSEWTEGVEYHNDTALTDTTQARYIDIVVTKDSTTGKVQTAYQCATTHTSSSDTKPSSETTDYWTEFNTMQPVYTPLLLADNAAISFVQGNQLLILDEDGNVCAGMAGAEYPLWVGATQATETDTAGNVTYAPFVVRKNGSFLAANGNFYAAADGTLSLAGFIKLKETQITTNNVSTYIRNVGTDTSPIYCLNVELMGGWCSFTDDNLTDAQRTIFFPETDAKKDADYFDSACAMVGAKVLIVNKTSNTLTLNNLYLEEAVKIYAASTSGGDNDTLFTLKGDVLPAKGKTITLAAGAAITAECVVVERRTSALLSTTTSKILWKITSRASSLDKSSSFTPTAVSSNPWYAQPTIK